MNKTYLNVFVSEDGGQVCENLTLAMDYKWFWQANALTNVTLIRTVGTIVLNSSGKGPKKCKLKTT